MIRPLQPPLAGDAWRWYDVTRSTSFFDLGAIPNALLPRCRLDDIGSRIARRAAANRESTLQLWTRTVIKHMLDHFELPVSVPFRWSQFDSRLAAARCVPCGGAVTLFRDEAVHIGQDFETDSQMGTTKSSS